MVQALVDELITESARAPKGGGEQAVLLRVADAGGVATQALGDGEYLVDDQDRDQANDDADHDLDQAGAALLQGSVRAMSHGVQLLPMTAEVSYRLPPTPS